jgi:PAS domain S-box-containing protein
MAEMRLTLERKIQIGFAIAVVIIVAVGAAALRSTAATVESARWVARTLEIRGDLEATLADLIDAETGVRGYVITGDTTYLAPYDSAGARLDAHLAGLRALTADNPVQLERLDSLATLVAARLERFHWTIATRRTGGPSAAGRAVIGGGGKELMHLVRGLVSQMEDEEGRLLALRSAALQTKARLTRFAAWGGALVAVALAVIASVLISRELSGRLRAELALGETQARFRQVLASSTAVIYANTVSGASFSPSWVSENVTRITGYGPDEPLQPAWWLDNLHPDDRGRVLAEMSALLANDQLRTEYRFRYQDGSYHWVHDEARLLRSATGTPVEVFGSWVDITDRRGAEEALRVSEERFRALAVTANDAIIAADSHGDIAYFNPGAERIFGYPATEVDGKPLTVLMPDRLRDAHRAGIARYLATGEARVVGKTVELAGRKKDGTEFPLELSLASWQRGSEIAFTAIIRDITERKEAEETLRRHTAQLEASNAELNAFAYSVSHDLRTPLRGIDGFSQALLEDYADRLDDVGKSYLTRVRVASQRMATLIDDLLDLSRVTRSAMHIGPLDLSALASGIAADLQKRDPARRVELAIAPGLHVQADPGLMGVALHNLLENAWKFTGKRTDARIELGSVPHDGRSAYFVRDNGAGFDMTYVGKLFGAFQRLHGAEEFAGNGIGLATVQRIIHRHGGRVWAEGTVGAGATFYFTL